MRHFKNFLYAIVALTFFSSCEAGTLPTDSVGLSAALAHCAHSVSYWAWGIIVTLGATFSAWKIKQNYEKTGSISPVALFLLAAALLIVWLYRPSEIAWNTTVEQAARGVWIGY